MHAPQDVAQAFLIEGEVDIALAKLLSGTEYHSRTIYFAQQAGEKMVKACLALKGVYTTDHNLSSTFRAVYESVFPEMEEIVRDMDALERHGARVRFPLFSRADLPLWIPSKSYTEEDALRALRSGEHLCDVLKRYLGKTLGGTTS